MRYGSTRAAAFVVAEMVAASPVLDLVTTFVTVPSGAVLVVSVVTVAQLVSMQ